MLNLRVIRKFHDPKTGLLLGYTVKDTNTGETMNVHKTELKRAVINKTVTVENMTLTSDGRLIGRACERPKAPVRKAPNLEAELVYNLGKEVIGMIIEDKNCGKKSFMFGVAASESIKEGVVKVTENTKKKPFKAVYERSYKTIAEKLGDSKLEATVEKLQQKERYKITFNLSKICNDEVTVGLVHMCIEYCMRVAKIKVIGHYNDNIEVNCLTGIADVRKALRDGKVNKL